MTSLNTFNGLCLLSLILVTRGYIQELTFHENEDESGNIFIFRNDEPDMTIHGGLRTSTRYCYRGIWYTYTNLDYDGTAYNGVSPKKTCKNLTVYENGQFKQESFRRFGASDTSTDALSIVNTFFSPELYIDTPALAGITNVDTYATIFQTGPGPWTIFEGPNFSGNHTCIPGTGSDGVAMHFNIRSSLNLTTVGSVVKGCYPNFLIHFPHFQDF